MIPVVLLLVAQDAHPVELYREAGQRARAGKKEEAIALLDRIADLGIAFEPGKDPDFASLRETPELEVITKRFAANMTPTSHSRVAFEIPEDLGLPEGITYDPARRRFLIGTVSTRKLLSVDHRGKVHELASDKDGLWSVLGMAVDQKRDILWAATSAIDEKRKAALVKVDLTRDKVIGKYLLPEDGREHVLGDVTVSSAGDAYTSDSVTPAIYRLRRGHHKLEVFVGGAPFRSPQGLCMSKDEATLFVADSALGIFAIDLATGKPIRLEVPDSVTVAGIDGLSCYHDSLIATQNGFHPNRVLRIFVDRACRKIDKAVVLESNHPDFSEVTLGVVVRDAFFYVAGPSKILRLQL